MHNFWLTVENLQNSLCIWSQKNLYNFSKIDILLVLYLIIPMKLEINNKVDLEKLQKYISLFKHHIFIYK